MIRSTALLSLSLIAAAVAAPVADAAPASSSARVIATLDADADSTTTPSTHSGASTAGDRRGTSVVAPADDGAHAPASPRAAALRRRGAIMLGVGAAIAAVGVAVKFGEDPAGTTNAYTFFGPTKTYNGLNYMMMIAGGGLAVGGISMMVLSYEIDAMPSAGTGTGAAAHAPGVRLMVTHRF